MSAEENKKITPQIRYIETKIPKYKFVEEELRVPKIVEYEVESISRKDLELLKQYGVELDRLYERLQKLKNYKIIEEEIRIKQPVFEKQIIIDPQFVKKQVIEKEYTKVIEEIKIPKLKEIPLEGFAREDVLFLKDLVASARELKKELDGLRHYTLREETVTYEKPIYKAVVNEIDTERINWIIKDEVITNLEELAASLKKKRGNQ